MIVNGHRCLLKNSKRSLSFSSVESNDQTAPVCEKRILEVEILQKCQPLAVQLIFQDAPIWLFSLDPQQVSKLYLPQYQNEQHLLSVLNTKGINSTLSSRVLRRFGTKVCFWQESVSPLTIITVSGSLSYITPFLRDQTLPTVVSLDTHYFGKIRQGRPNGVACTGLGHVDWYRIRHTSVGGASKFVALIGVSGLSLTPSMSPLRRTLRHYIDYSIRPMSWVPVISTPESCLTVDDFIHPSSLEQTIRYATHFSSTGIGYRSLTGEELASIYGLHSRIRIGGMKVQDS